MTAVHLVTFADGGPGYVQGRNLLVDTAQASQWFKTIKAYDLATLALESPTWFETHRKFITNNRRGLGYWIWKPEVIRIRLSQIGSHDVLLYLDAGCQINPYGKRRFEHYVRLCQDYGMLCFFLNGPNYTIGQWTKVDLLNRFNIAQNDPLLTLPQVEAGVSFYMATTKTHLSLSSWELLASENGYSMLSDSPSIDKESDQFIEHRHDQAIFTLLHYLDNWGKSIKNENYHPLCWSEGTTPKAYPILATRFINEDRPSVAKLRAV